MRVLPWVLVLLVVPLVLATPTVDISCPKVANAGEPVTISFSARDPNGLRTVVLLRGFSGSIHTWKIINLDGDTEWAWDYTFIPKYLNRVGLEYAISARSVDGNLAVRYCRFTVRPPKFETNPPVIVASAPEGTLVRRLLPVRVYAEDDTFLSRIAVDCGNGQRVVYPSVFGELWEKNIEKTFYCYYTSPGHYTIVVDARDIFGNTATKVLPINVVELPQDLYPPQITLEEPADGATFDAPAEVPIRFTVSDDTGIRLVRVYCIGGEPWADGWAAEGIPPKEKNFEFVCTYTKPGKYTIVAEARDFSGRVTRRSVTIFVSAPEIYANISAPETVQQGDAVRIRLSAYASAGLRSVEFYIDGTLAREWHYFTDKSFEAEYVWTASDPGAHTLRLVVVDGKGGKAEDTAVVEVLPPGSPVSVSVSVSAPERATACVAFEVNVAAESPNGLTRVTLGVRYPDGTTHVVREWNLSGEESFRETTYHSATTPGTYTFWVRAIDTQGFEGYAETDVIVEPGMECPPDVQILSPEEDVVTTAPARIDVSASVHFYNDPKSVTVDCGNGDSRTFSVGSRDVFVGYTCEYDTPGDYVITVSAEDAMGAVGTDRRSVTIVSTPAPVFAELNVPPEVPEGPVNVEIRAYDEQGLREVNLYVDDQLEARWTPEGQEFVTVYTWNAEPGAHTLRLRVAGESGVVEDNATVNVLPAETGKALDLTPVSGIGKAYVVVRALESGEYVPLTCADITYSVSPSASTSCTETYVEGVEAARISIGGDPGEYTVSVTWDDVTESVAVRIFAEGTSVGYPAVVAILLALFFFLLLR